MPDDPDMLGYIDLRKVIDMAQSFDDSALDRDVYDALERESECAGLQFEPGRRI